MECEGYGGRCPVCGSRMLQKWGGGSRCLSYNACPHCVFGYGTWMLDDNATHERFAEAARQIVAGLRGLKEAGPGAGFRLNDGESAWEAFKRVWQGVGGENSPWLEEFVFARCEHLVASLPDSVLRELLRLTGRRPATVGGLGRREMIMAASERLWEVVYERAEHEPVGED